MKDRLPTLPGRVKITPENSEPAFFATVTQADEPTEPGTEYSKAHVLPDSTALNLGARITDDVKPKDAFNILAPAIHIANRIYMGRDLTEVYEREGGYPNIWAWLNARIQAGDFSYINVGDYIPFVTSANIVFEAQVAGINTYTEYGETGSGIGNHIDFITIDCHPDARTMNRVNYNNGTTVDASPWLASEAEAWLNSKSKSVVNATTANPAMVTANYTATGVLTTLPTELRAVIKTKRLYVPTRFTAGSLLTDDNSAAWKDMGPLWLPYEWEVYGDKIWGSEYGHSRGGQMHYPLFVGSMMPRVKKAGKNGTRTGWWLASAIGGSSTLFAFVHSSGFANHISASNSAIRVPLCFRI